MMPIRVEALGGQYMPNREKPELLRTALVESADASGNEQKIAGSSIRKP